MHIHICMYIYIYIKHNVYIYIYMKAFATCASSMSLMKCFVLQKAMRRQHQAMDMAKNSYT